MAIEEWPFILLSLVQFIFTILYRFRVYGVRVFCQVFDDITHFSDVQLLRKKMKRMPEASGIGLLIRAARSSCEQQRKVVRFTFF